MLNGSDECILQDEDANFNAETWDDLMNGCPVQKLPDKKDYKNLSDENPMKAWGNGWNACLDAITGGAWMRVLKSEPYSDTDKLADDALEELNSLGLGYGAHTVIGMALGKLKAYESTGLAPEQVKELEEDYAAKGTLLAEYQSTGLTPEQIQEIDKAFYAQAKELMEYRNAKEHGLLLCLPCKVWDKVYIIDDVEKEIEESQVYGIDIDGDGITIMIADYMGASSSTGYTVDEFEDTVFLTREDAEIALAELE